MAEKKTLQQFGASVKAKYPAYANQTDEEVAQAVLKKYPVYADRVEVAPERPPMPPAKANDGGFSGTILGGLKKAQMGPPVPPEIFARAKAKEMTDAAKKLSDNVGVFNVGKNIVKEVAKGGLEVVKGIFGSGMTAAKDLATDGQYSRTAPEEKTFLGGVKRAAGGLVGITAAPFTAGINTVTEAIPDQALKERVQGGLAKYGDVTGAIGTGLAKTSDVIRAGLGKAPTLESETASRAVRDYTKAGLDVGLARGALKKTFGIQGEPKIIQKRTEVLQGIEKKNAPLRKLMEKERARGHDPAKDVAGTDLLVDAVNKDGVISTKQPGGAVSQYQELMKPIEGRITQALRSEGKKVPLKVVEDTMRREVESSGVKGASKVKALRQVDDEIAGLKLDADKNGYIDLSDIQAAKIDKYGNVNYLNESGRVDKAIGRGLKKVIEDNMESLDAKAANAVLSRHMANLRYLESLDGRIVSGGRLGKYFATAVGTVVGSHFGPFGAIAGAELGGRIKGGLMSRTFGKMTGRNMEFSPEEISALTPREVVKPKLLGTGPLRMGPKSSDASGLTTNPFRPGFGMASPEDYYRPMSKNLLPERAGESPITLPRSARESTLGLDEVRGTVQGQRSSSSNSLGSRQMAQTTNATNPIKPKNIIEGQVKPSTALGGSKAKVKLGALGKAKKVPTSSNLLSTNVRKYKIREFDSSTGESVLKEVDGEPIVVHKDLETFLNQDENGNWVVTEAKTGTSLTSGGLPTKKHAIDYARSVIEEIGIKKVKERINQFLQQSD